MLAAGREGVIKHSFMPRIYIPPFLPTSFPSSEGGEMNRITSQFIRATTG